MSSKADEEHAFDGAPDRVFLGTGGATNTTPATSASGKGWLIGLGLLAALLFLKKGKLL